MTKDKGIIRVQKNKDNPYVMINKEFLSNEQLSWKSKGILAYLLSKPDNWQVIVGDLIKQSTDGERAVRSGLKELKENSYLQKYPVYQDKKIIRWDSIVYETPFIDSEKIKYVFIDDEGIESAVLGQNVKVDEHVENTVLVQNVHVGNVQVGNVHVENAQHNNNDFSNNDFNNNDFNNHSFIQEGKNEQTIDIESLKVEFGEEILTEAIHNSKSCKASGQSYFNYLHKACESVRVRKKIESDSIPIHKKNLSKNRFHNFTGNTTKYTSEELEKILQIKTKNKYA